MQRLSEPSTHLSTLEAESEMPTVAGRVRMESGCYCLT